MQGSVAYPELDTVGERENVLPVRLEVPRKWPDVALSPHLPGVKIEFANSIEFTLPTTCSRVTARTSWGLTVLLDGRHDRSNADLGSCGWACPAGGRSGHHGHHHFRTRDCFVAGRHPLSAVGPSGRPCRRPRLIAQRPMRLGRGKSCFAHRHQTPGGRPISALSSVRTPADPSIRRRDRDRPIPPTSSRPLGSAAGQSSWARRRSVWPGDCGRTPFASTVRPRR